MIHNLKSNALSHLVHLPSALHCWGEARGSIWVILSNLFLVWNQTSNRHCIYLKSGKVRMSIYHWCSSVCNQVAVLRITSIKEFRNISSNIMFKQEFTTWVICHIVSNIKHQIIKYDECQLLLVCLLVEFITSHRFFRDNKGWRPSTLVALVYDFANHQDCKKCNDMNYSERRLVGRVVFIIEEDTCENRNLTDSQKQSPSNLL